MRYLGIDLAWGEGSPLRQANETGLCAIDAAGTVVAAGWARGIGAVFDWIVENAAPDGEGTVVAVDAPLVVPNATGMRESEKQVARAYGRWKVAANASNQALGWLGGVTLRDRLEEAGFRTVSGVEHPSPDDRVFFECYPYTTLVGAEEFGYDLERPRYKRLPKGVPAPEARAARAIVCDDLIVRMSGLTHTDPPLDLASHPVTRQLLDEPSPVAAGAYKHREDLVDSALCAWTASLWHRHGDARVQILGKNEPRDARGRHPTIVAPARPAQRLDG